MKKIRLRINCNGVDYYSKSQEVTNEYTVESFENFLTKLCRDTRYLTFRLENGNKIFLPGKFFEERCHIIIEEIDT